MQEGGDGTGYAAASDGAKVTRPIKPDPAAYYGVRVIKRIPALPGAVFQSDSPFRRLPRDLDAKQRRFLEALRFGIEMAQGSYRRLREILSAMSLDDQQTLDKHSDAVATAFLDAWGVADSIHRLRELLAVMPNLKKGALLKLFSRKTQQVEKLRNHIQHLSGDLHEPALARMPVWGTVSWVWLVDRTHMKVISGSMLAGVDMGQSPRPFPIPQNRIFHDVLDHVTLSLGNDELNLSEAMRLTVRIARGLEKQLEVVFRDCEPLPLVDSRLLLTIELDAPVAIAPAKLDEKVS